MRRQDIEMVDTRIEMRLGSRPIITHPLLSYPYVKDAPWPDGSDNRFEMGVCYMRAFPHIVTREELLVAAGLIG